ncbi:MAG: hypothetical protein RI910_2951 [Verrucomicrobiota bacterium]
MTPTLYLRLATMVFLHFFVWSCWYNTMSVYLGKLNFTGTQVGLAYGTTAIGALVSPFLIGVIADRYVPAQRLLGGLHLIGAALLWWISQQTTFDVFYPSLIAYTLTYMAGHGLINTITLTHAPNPSRWFPVVMAAAAIGWIAAALVVNSADLADNQGMFKLACGIAVAVGLYSFTLPNTPPKGEAGPVSASKLLGLDALKLFKDRSFAVFMFCSFLICVPLSFYFTWTGAFLSEMKVADFTAKMTLGQAPAAAPPAFPRRQTHHDPRHGRLGRPLRALRLLPRAAHGDLDDPRRHPPARHVLRLHLRHGSHVR